MSVPKAPQWRTPAAMSVALLAGVAFAIGHHAFYKSLAGSNALSSNYNVAGWSVSRQQVNTAAGTAFAFLVKVFLVLAVSIAYTQTFWSSIGRGTTALKTLDIASSALDNIIALLRVEVWWKHPTMLLLALSVWLIPISSTITPATLSVALQPVETSSMSFVPRADFSSLKFINPGEIQGQWPVRSMQYQGAAHVISRVAQAVASNGFILPIEPPALNASWELSFNGPYLTCENFNSTFQRHVMDNIILEYRNGSYCENYYNYLAWTDSRVNTLLTQPGNGIDPSIESALPFARKKPYPMNTGTLGGLNFQGLITTNSTEVPTIYFAVMPEFDSLSPGECPLGNYGSQAESLDGFFNGATFLQCQLYNTSYHASFTYVDGAQTVEVDFPELDQAKPVNSLNGYFLDNGTCAELSSSNTSCAIDPVLLERLSFQAVMQSFGQVFVGAVHNGDLYEQLTAIQTTSVLSTTMLNTTELAFLTTTNNWTDAGYIVYNNSSSAEFQSLYDDATPPPVLSLKEGLEQLFQNITISMMSQSSLQPNLSSPFAPSPVNVTVRNLVNVYVYTDGTLWLAYGLAIAFTALGVLIGFIAIGTSGAAFSGDFSTILRATRNADVSVPVDQADDGRDPLPKELRGAVVRFRGVAGRHGEVEEIAEGPDAGRKGLKWPLAGRSNKKSARMRLYGLGRLNGGESSESI